MADSVEGTPAPRSREVGFDWISYERYQSIVLGQLEGLVKEGILSDATVQFDDTRLTDSSIAAVHLRAALVAAGGVIVSVNHWFEARRGPSRRTQIRLIAYSIHAVEGERRSRRDLVRYDDAHGALHRHAFDDDGQQVAVHPVQSGEVPALAELVRHAVALAAQR